MAFSAFKQSPEEDYTYLREDKSKQDPHVMEVQQTYPTDIYEDDTHQGKMTLNIQTFLAGLSILGLYAVYRLMRRHNSHYI